MAKRASGRQRKSNSGAQTIVVTADTPATLRQEAQLTFTKEDIVAIGVSNAEQQMQGRVRELQQAMGELNARLDELATEIAAARKAAIAQELAAFEDWARRMWTPIGIILDPKESSTSVHNETPMGVQLLCQAGGCNGVDIDADDDDENTDAANHAPPALAASARRAAKLSWPDSMRALITLRQGVQDELASVDQQRTHWLRKLSELPALERKFRARVAAEQLRQTDAGRAVLSRLEVDIDSDPDLQLPSRLGCRNGA